MRHRNTMQSALRMAMLSAAMTGALAAQSTAVPSNLNPPPGNQAFLKVEAVGTQNYLCMPSGWSFLGPQATLFVTVQWFNTTVRQQVGTHYLTPNPAEIATNRPLWQSSVDTSIVWAKPIATAAVDPSAIPWLLLETAGKQSGPSGGSSLTQTTYIQRIHTTGGLMPTTACSVGERAFVPYTADYVFFRQGGAQ